MRSNDCINEKYNTIHTILYDDLPVVISSVLIECVIYYNYNTEQTLGRISANAGRKIWIMMILLVNTAVIP